MVTEPHPSEAVAAPVALVRVSVAGHSRTRFVGMSKLGAIVSRTVIVWMPLAMLPQASVAFHAREITLVLPQALLIESVKVTVTAPQPSVAVALPVLLMLVLAGHSSVKL